MTKLERMKLAIQQKQAAAKIEAAPPPGTVMIGHKQLPLTTPPDEMNAPKKQKPPKPAKKPKPDGYETQPQRFDTALQLHDRSRLPDGSMFTMHWNNGDWQGMLVVPNGSGESVQFDLAGRKLFRLLADIDKLYREWKAKQPKPEGAT